MTRVTIDLPGAIAAYGFLVEDAADNEQLTQQDLANLRLLAEALKDARPHGGAS